MNEFLIQLLSFSSLALLVLGLNALLRGSKAAQVNSNRPGVFGWFADEISTVGRVVEPQLTAVFPKESKRIRDQLMAAALNHRLSVREVRGLQVGLGSTVAVVVALFILVVTLEGAYAVAGGLACGLLGYYYPLVWLRRTAQQRQDTISKELPFAIDLLTVAMEAGQDFGAAVRHLVEEVKPGPLQQEFSMMLGETDLGKSRIEAMRGMSARMQVEEFKAVVTAVVQSTEMGASVAAALKLQAEEIRRARFHRAERKAARAPSLMLIPLALFILPSVFIVILTPVIMRMVDTLHSVPK